MDTSRFQEQASSTLTNAAERYAKQLHAIKLLADVDLVGARSSGDTPRPYRAPPCR